MGPKSAPGPSWEGEISLGTPPGAPPEITMNFFGSGGLRERFGSPPGRSKKDFMLHSLFFRSRGAPGSDLGAILGRFGLDFGRPPGAVLKRFRSDFRASGVAF